MALCHAPSRLKATSIFSSGLSMLFSRCVMMIGVRQIFFGRCCFSSIRQIPFSEYIHPSGCLRLTGAPLIASGISSSRWSRSTFLAAFNAFCIFPTAASFPNLMYNSDGSFTPNCPQLQTYTSPMNPPSRRRVVIFVRNVSPPRSGSLCRYNFRSCSMAACPSLNREAPATPSTGMFMYRSVWVSDSPSTMAA